MGDHAYITELLAGVLYLIAGARLLRLASRTGEVPERLLGLMFLVTGAAYLLWDINPLLGSEALWTPINFAARVVYLPAPFILAIFTRRVFRRESLWASWLVCGCAVLLVAGVTGSALRGDWDGFSLSNGWFWLEWVGYTLPYGWAGAESFLQWDPARRRMLLSLCDPLVCNRLLLWGLFGVAQLCTSLATLGQYAAYQQANVFTAGWDIVVGTCEILSIALIWLVFFPPVAYRSWIENHAAIADAAARN